MASSFHIHGQHQDAKVEPTRVTATGGPTYPVLQVPVDFKLSPLQDYATGGSSDFIITNVRGGLFIKDRAEKISDGISNDSPHFCLFCISSSAIASYVPIQTQRHQELVYQAPGS